MAISFFISRDKFGSEWFFVVFGDCERLVVLAVVACIAGPAGSSVLANFFHKGAIDCFTGV